MRSLTDSSIKQYNSHLRYWWIFCTQNSLNPYNADDKAILKCLTLKFKEEASYSTLNSLRSAIAKINSSDNNQSVLLRDFFKGVFKSRPPTARYNSTWDVSPVLEKIESWGSNDSLSLHLLTIKLTMLLALGSAFRIQSLSLIKLNNISSSNQGVEIKISDLIKTSRPGAAQPCASFHFYKKESLCVARTILHYVSVTKKLRGKSNQLLISYQKPHKEVSRETIGRWIKFMLRESGIDEKFTAHSTRHAATSKALLKGISINKIKEVAGWSENSDVFLRFYNRPVIDSQNSFISAVFD